MNILLVEPYRYKYVPIGLIKLYTYYKKVTDANVSFTIGKHKFDNKPVDRVYISSGEFSYEHQRIISVVKFYRREYPDTDIIVGGVYLTLNKSFETEVVNLGCITIRGTLDYLDSCILDYTLFNHNPWNFVFTTRGCPMKCKFCYVEHLEPVPKICTNWKAQILYSNPKYTMIHDNNITAFGVGHFMDVCDTLLRSNKLVMFDNGFDCRFWNGAFNGALSRIAHLLGYSSVRFAFDSMNQDGKIQRAIKMVSTFYPAEDILVYVLANNGPIEETKYRASEVQKCGAYPFIQRYAPMDWTGPLTKYKGEYYTPELDIVHDYYNNKMYKEASYEDYRAREENKEIK